MAKGCRGRRMNLLRKYRLAPYPLPSNDRRALGDVFPKKFPKAFEKKDWVDVTCSVCMEFPHNAVLLLCSSYDKGCRPYMCGTSFRFSNCLDQYKTAHAKSTSESNIDTWHVENCQLTELACPLCRGKVKGWTVVEPARGDLNEKKRGCMQDDCLFVGNYKELKKHVKIEHPAARPREVDPVLEQKWLTLERDREREDVISTITSSIPGAMVFGDYVIERPDYGSDSEEEDFFGTGLNDRADGFDSGLYNVVLLLHALGPYGTVDRNREFLGIRRLEPSDRGSENISDEDVGDRVRRRRRARGQNRGPG